MSACVWHPGNDRQRYTHVYSVVYSNMVSGNLNISRTYCWWTNSCTSWYSNYLLYQLQCFSNPNWFPKSCPSKMVNLLTRLKGFWHKVHQAWSTNHLIDDVGFSQSFFDSRYKSLTYPLETPGCWYVCYTLTWSGILICLWDAFNSRMLHHVQTHNTYRIHSIISP